MRLFVREEEKRAHNEMVNAISKWVIEHVDKYQKELEVKSKIETEYVNKKARLQQKMNELLEEVQQIECQIKKVPMNIMKKLRICLIKI